MQKVKVGGAGQAFANRCELHGVGLTITHCRVVAPGRFRPAPVGVDQLVVPECLLRKLACLRGQLAVRAISGQGW